MSIAVPVGTWRTIALSIAICVVSMVVFSIAVEQADVHLGWSEDAAHAIGHAALGIPLLALRIAASRVWPPAAPTSNARRSRRLVLIGITLITIGQGLESLGAIGGSSDGRIGTALTVTHDAGIIAGPLGIVLVAGGVALILHRPSAKVGITDIAIIVIGVIGIAGLFIGIPAPIALFIVLGTVVVVAYRMRRSRPSETIPADADNSKSRF